MFTVSSCLSESVFPFFSSWYLTKSVYNFGLFWYIGDESHSQSNTLLDRSFDDFSKPEDTFGDEEHGLDLLGILNELVEIFLSCSFQKKLCLYTVYM